MEKKSLLEKFGLIEKIEKEIVKTDAEQIKDDFEETNVENKANKIEFKEVLNHIIESDDPLSKAKNKNLMGIQEIYKNYNINSQGLNSLSIVERYQKALPDYMPTDIKRQSILNIIESSDVKIENLVNDGDEKLKCLKDFSQSFSIETNEIILKFENEIKKLSEKIDNYNKAIANMKSLQNEQDFTVKYEIEKINNILQFIDYGK